MANSWESLIASWEPELRRAFLESAYQLRNVAQLDAIIRMLERSDIDGAIRAVGLDPASFRPLDRAISQAYEAGGAATARTIPAVVGADGFRVIVQFNIRNLAAESWLAAHSSGLITGIIEDQRAAIRDYLRAGMERGINPRTTALDLVGRINAATGRREGGVIGLTQSQTRWLINYERELNAASPAEMARALTRNLRDKRFDAAVRKAIANEEAIPAATREAAIRAYRNRALRYRAEVIARTESLTSLHAAQHAAMEQAIASGAVRADTVTFTWRSAKDDRVRDTHRAMNGQKKLYGEAFESPSGARLRFPGDPLAPIEETAQCRCWTEPSIDHYRDLR